MEIAATGLQCIFLFILPNIYTSFIGSLTLNLFTLCCLWFDTVQVNVFCWGGQGILICLKVGMGSVARDLEDLPTFLSEKRGSLCS